jgi:hypothetical protein
MMPEEAVYKIFETYDYQFNLGVVRLEQWPEGLVLWVGGEVKWQSWEDDDGTD